MAAVVYQTILQEAAAKGIIPLSSSRAIDWFRKTAQQTSVTGAQVVQQTNRTSVATTNMNPACIGRMFLFKYDAKTKQTLPYWDQYPLIFPFAMNRGGFKGINLHYLNPKMRAVLMDGLYSITNHADNVDQLKLNLTYKLLQSMSKLRYFKPCVKQYITSQARSKFVYIEPKYWDIVLMLPIAKFQKQTEDFVWQDSINRINADANKAHTITDKFQPQKSY